MFQVSARGLDIIKDYEKFRAKSYLDSKQVWTIGYGTTRWRGRPVGPGMVMTHDEALEALYEHVQTSVAVLNNLVRVPLTQNQVDALISLMYNIGDGGFASSTLLKRINAGAPITEDLFTRWNKIRDPNTGQLVVLDGLTNRRRREYALFMEG